MKTNGTEGNEGQSASTITEGTTKGTSVELEGFNLEGLGKDTVETPEQIKAKADADAEAAKLAKEAADKEAAAKGSASANNTDTVDTFFEFEDKKFKIDENGNALNEDGTVFKTKEELEVLKNTSNESGENNGEVSPLIEEVIQLNGVEILDETTGKPKVYEDSVQGLLEYAKDFAVHQVKESQIQFFKQYPQAKELAQHLAKGGSEEEFYKIKTSSWKNYTLDTSNEAQLSEVITKDLIAKGHSKEEAAELVALYKDSNKLEEKGKTALDNRRKDEAALDAKKEAEGKQKAIEYQTRIENYWKEVSDVVKKGALENIIIPENDKEGFLKYISLAVDKQGRSQYDLDEMSDKTESDLQYKYLRYKKFDLSKLVKSSAATMRATSLRERLKQQEKETKNSGGAASKEMVNPNNLDITLNSVFGQ